MMRKMLLVGAALVALNAGPVLAQSSPNWALGYVPNPAEWNGWWAKKLDYTPPGWPGGQVLIGPVTMFDSYPGTNNLKGVGTIVSVSSNASPALIVGTRTSDGGSTGGQGAWALGSFTYNDNASAVQTSYGGYFEARRVNASAGTTHGIEITVVNQGGVVDSDPYFMGVTGSTLGLWLAAGRSGLGLTEADSSLAIGIIPTGASWRKGIVFGNNSVWNNPALGAEAISMPTGYAIDWYASDRTVVSMIRSDITASPGTRGPQIVFSGTGGFLISAGGTNTGDELQWANNSVVVKALTITQSIGFQLGGIIALPGQFADDAAAAAGGVALFGAYVDTSGILHQRRS